MVRDLDAELPLFNVRTLTDHIETNLVFRRVPARLFSILGPLLLMLAAIGIYAVVAYTVSLRTMEIGVRLALGATVRRLIAQFVGESLVVVGLGALAGWALALAAAIVIAPTGRRCSRRAGDSVPAAALACWIPVRRATRIRPWRYREENHRHFTRCRKQASLFFQHRVHECTEAPEPKRLSRVRITT